MFHDKTEDDVDFDGEDDIRAAGRFDSKQKRAETVVAVKGPSRQGREEGGGDRGCR